MSKIAVILMSFLMIAVGSVVIILTQNTNGANAIAKNADRTTSLPISLDDYFPPKAEQPIYLMRMLGMARPLAGIMADLSENDFANVMANFEQFKTQYVGVSKLVPEWEEDFPLAPVNELGDALKSGDQGKVMAAFGSVGKVCADCHLAHQSKAYYKYHYGDFHGIKVTDPLTQQQVDFQQFMLFLDVCFNGIALNVEQGQIENAKRQLRGFRARFETLEESCQNCHDTERHYYVDPSVKAMIEKLEQTLDASPVDPKQIGMISQGIGIESCFKCHLVHVPAAAAQTRQRLQ